MNQTTSEKTLSIAIVSGEQSGDELGAAVMQSLKNKYPNIRFFGVGGDKMIAQGLESLFDQERLAVMGLVEPLKRLPDLLNAKKTIVNECLERQPDCYLGIDSPDFNLRVAKELKNKGLTTVHYVSPSVWAWRQGRIKGIRKSIDLMLTLFPFERDFYLEHDVDSICVGHPLADQLPIEKVTKEEKQAIISQMNLADMSDKKIVTLMPGSREVEIQQMGQLFLDAANRTFIHRTDTFFIIPAANDLRAQQLKSMLAQYGKNFQKHCQLIDKDAHAALKISDAVLVASGTSTLEAMLLKCPMVVAYRLSKMTYNIAKFLVKTPYVSLPNLIAQEPLVKELIQDEANIENLSSELLALLDDDKQSGLQQRFKSMHIELQQNASDAVADALLSLIQTGVAHGKS